MTLATGRSVTAPCPPAPPPSVPPPGPPRPAQPGPGAGGRLAVPVREELAADEPTRVARRADVLDQLVPVGHLGTRLAQHRRPPDNRERRPHGLPAGAGVGHAV